MSNEKLTITPEMASAGAGMALRIIRLFFGSFMLLGGLIMSGVVYSEISKINTFHEQGIETTATVSEIFSKDKKVRCTNTSGRNNCETQNHNYVIFDYKDKNGVSQQGKEQGLSFEVLNSISTGKNVQILYIPNEKDVYLKHIIKKDPNMVFPLCILGAGLILLLPSFFKMLFRRKKVDPTAVIQR
jgi:hypothetical protein